jgi:VWFA-related protein
MRKQNAATNSRISRASTAVCLLFPLLLSTSAKSLQVNPSPPNDADEYRISVSVGLVVLPVTVTDRKGEFVPGLKPQDFHVYEAGRLQQITFFEPEDVPVTVGLVVDNSGSMGPKRPSVIAASLAFVRSSNSQDQMFVVNFNQKVSLGLPKSIPFTSDLQQLQGALSKNPAFGNTALYDAIAAALLHVKAGTRDKKALIVVTDGGDNASRMKFSDLLKMAESSNATIYTIGILDQAYSDQNPKVLRQLSKVTGGRAYFPESVAEVFNASKQISQDLRRQYTIGYIPTDRAPDGKYRALRVTAKAAGKGKLNVRTRTGYVIPLETPNSASIAQRGSL